MKWDLEITAGRRPVEAIGRRAIRAARYGS